MYQSPTPADRSEEDPQKHRKRISRACDSCYKRKIKCDAAVPQCNWCSHHDIPCTFNRVITRKRKAKTDAKGEKETTGLAERIERIEKFLTENLLKEPTPSATPPSVNHHESPIESHPSSYTHDFSRESSTFNEKSGSSSVPLHFAGRELGCINLFTGIPLLLPEGKQWVQSRTGQNISLSKLVTSNKPPWERQRALASNALVMNPHPESAFELPDRTLIDTYFRLFCISFVRRIFPVVDPILFKETIENAYQQPRTRLPYGKVSTRACVLAFAAFISLVPPLEFETEFRKLAPLNSEAYFTRAQCLVPQVLQESASVEGLQVVSMMALFELVTGNLQSASYYGSIAARMIFLLGGHTTSSMTEDPETSQNEIAMRSQRQIRYLFWLGYTIEKDVSLRTGQPQLFTEDNCDLTIPATYSENLFKFPIDCRQIPPEDMPEDPVYPVDIRLSIIKARAYNALYSFKGLKKTDAEILKEIRELDDELEKWRLSIPLAWRPTLSFVKETPDPNANMHSVILRLNYHLCMTIIHQASGRCRDWSKEEGGIMHGVNSSLALSVEASRSTLLYLQASEHVLIDGIFWTLIFYPMSALLAIFCNILQNPSDPQATKDLGLLKTAMSMLERIFLRQPSSVNEIVHIKMIADYVSELYRLASCAIEKAWYERSG
ncbi:transcriptional regulator family: Fungal Specific TF [Aspergillus niger]|uniref:Zn(II)2Cys6 transcription factor n=1 Tax=Aspergillus niger ATCC 13496 TaxID=1353008 RepID=A0A370C522_ASPNG|nr:transcriptional regulator family: Fungal Specific TF [Aspergillus niger]RDH21240.1 Zn(II)2Cys6 transcription factor [Aspergillus niger ATCC 13496]KAI2848351.1 transcriptional regulator family: Fungal Specific TF [Aspergillus niger]KAI2856422.1 transcriptional regulator family: Fungal Specific TF [Aspergillus niger]KAI2876961.1 transcriptional regulator family: Fungal Specific TF [Aspergillus niger]